MISSIRDDNPVLFVEHRHLYYQKGHVPEEPYALPFGRARVILEGEDITLVGVSQMGVECLRAGKYLSESGIRAEVIDPVSLCPLDMETIRASVLKTGKLIVVDNAWSTCGAGAEIITRLIEGRLPHDTDLRRMGFAFSTCPTTPTLEERFYPDAKKIAAKAYEMLYPGRDPWIPAQPLHIEEVEFKGPF